MSATDFVIASLIVLGAVVLLVRPFLRGGGPCGGCSGGGCSTRACARPGTGSPPIVTLGSPRRD